MLISSSLIADISYKIIFVGDSHVGKTALISRFKSDTFDLHARPTVGVEFAKRIVRYKRSNQSVQIHLWDTAGQERYKAITKQFGSLTRYNPKLYRHYRGANAALVIFDLDQPNSFDSIVNWVNEVKDNSPPGCLLGIVGNKADIDSPMVLAASNEAYNFARENKVLYFETSAYWSRTEEGTPSRPFAKGVETIIMDTIENIAMRDPKKSMILYDMDGTSENENLSVGSVYETIASRFSTNNMFGETMTRSVCISKSGPQSAYKETPKVNLDIKSTKNTKTDNCACQ